MDPVLVAKLQTSDRINQLARKIAAQDALVLALGQGNTTQLSAEDLLAQRAEYEIALATLASMRDQLATMVRERNTWGYCL
jgi:tartrate dehydratase beta subunit/fumarate hydratase class I family protein